ncbi:hypothetical protein GCM10010425_69300 [Streptomyces spororaveus]|uniref:Uncharacterized protein n=1 Tax=Streptomyces spororaveus TaxID=284039 RepID=A0ABQ3TLX0_9ACTN|nr:hypothetical protein Sspor_69710 [Streptomyces spororaveus]
MALRILPGERLGERPEDVPVTHAACVGCGGPRGRPVVPADPVHLGAGLQTDPTTLLLGTAPTPRAHPAWHLTPIPTPSRSMEGWSRIRTDRPGQRLPTSGWRVDCPGVDTGPGCPSVRPDAVSAPGIPVGCDDHDTYPGRGSPRYPVGSGTLTETPQILPRARGCQAEGTRRRRVFL